MTRKLPEREYRVVAEKYKAIVERRFATLMASRKEPRFVYEPVSYALRTGGKRIRSVMVLLACEAVGGSPRSALDAAVAVELFHNFTLVHDDVMDNAALRRGQPTVCKKWNRDVAILSGDELLALAYRFLLKTKSPHLARILNVFTDAFVKVCEGQGFDKEFESLKNVTSDDYLMMVRKKTGRLISAATEIGGLIGNGSAHEIAALRRFGEWLGMAFQIKDDVLDIAGDEEEFGKTIGGDIMEGKKTYLIVKALERVKGADRKLLQKVIPGNTMDKKTIMHVLEIYRRERVLDDARNEIARNTRFAEKEIAVLKSSNAKSTLLWLSKRLLARNS